MIRPGRTNRWKRLVLLFLMVFLIPTLSVQAAHKDYEPDELYQVMEQALAWKKSEEGIREGNLFQKEFLSLAGSSGGDWYALSLGRMGKEDDYFSYLSRMKFAMTKAYETENKLSDQKATEWHRISLAILSLGGDPTSFGETPEGEPIDLIKDGTYGRPKNAPLGAQGMNGYVYGLITLDALRYQVPETAEMDREEILQRILDNQLEGGGFSLDGGEASIDLTAMALTALAPYRYLQKTFFIGNKEITMREAMDQGVFYLSENQSHEGDFSNFGSYNLESSAQVMVALTSLGVDPVNDKRFIKNNHNVLDGLMKYQNKEGSFDHNLLDGASLVDKTTSSTMATEQALYGLVSLYRYQTHMRGLYDFRPEMTDSMKEKISLLEKAAATLTDMPLLEIEDLGKIYKEIPKFERMGIKDLDLLYARWDDLAIAYEPIVLEDFNENIGGQGTITSLKGFKPMVSVLRFNESDEEALLFLEKEYGILDEAKLNTLYEKLEKAENRDDFPGVLEKIEKMQLELSMGKERIEALNKEILEKAYPFDHLGKEDESLVEDLLTRINLLKEEDKALVLGYEDLILAKTRIKTNQREKVILGVVLAFLVVTLVLLGGQIKKSRRKKRENTLEEEELDW